MAVDTLKTLRHLIDAGMYADPVEVLDRLVADAKLPAAARAEITKQAADLVRAIAAQLSQG